MLMGQLGNPSKIMTEASYLHVDAKLQDKWLAQLGGHRRRIGIAWSCGVEHKDDFPRSIEFAQLVEMLDGEGELISVQQQGREPFEDFADCAAFMSLLDEIVTVDTAAVHLAGAIGHPRITLLLSHWASWRWQLPLYRNLHICQQDSPGDWQSAIAKRS
jgi:ADP-heptose:LPS heptosyltransferase